MSERIKVAVLGGSSVATPELALAIRDAPGRALAIDLVLTGRSEDKLETVARAARILAGDDNPLRISATTSLDEALTGADYVLNQVRVGGYEARLFDETFPDALGLPGEETVGPGGFANAVRTIPVVLDLARRMERCCPEAMVLNLANPSSLVQFALARYSRLRTIGLCDAPLTLKNSIARALGVEADRLSMDYAGMHHFGFVGGIRLADLDLMPRALSNAADIVPDIDPGLVRALGVIPGHYLRYIFHPDRMLARKKGRPSRAEELLRLQDEILAEYRTLAAGRGGVPPRRSPALERRGAAWYRMIVVPALTALIAAGRGEGPSGSEFILDLVNGRVLPWLPGEAIVEVPAVIRRGGADARPGAALPPDVQGLIQANCLYESLAVEAIVEKDRSKALRALLRNPMIRTYDQAAAVLDKAWDRA